MESGNNMSLFFCEDEKWKYDTYDKPGYLNALWGYGETEVPSRRFAMETNLSEPDASATVIKNKHLQRINTEGSRIRRLDPET